MTGVTSAYLDHAATTPMLPEAVAAQVTNNSASSIGLSAQGTLSIYGFATARDTGGDIHLHGGDSILVDGLVDAADTLTMTGGGQFGA